MIIHRDDAALEAFIEAVRSENLTGFTLLRSSGIGRTTEAKPLEFSFMDLLKGQDSSRLENSTLLSFVDDERLARVIELLKQHITDFDAPGGGMYAVLPVESFGGVE